MNIFGVPYEDDAFDATFRAYALKYFEIHAAQRMQAFRFFVIFSIPVGGAMMHYWNKSDWQSVVLGIVLSVLSVVFWALDKRTCQLVENGEQALKFLDKYLADQDGEPHSLALFARDERIKERQRFNIISYKSCFNVVFALGFFGGLAPILTVLCS